MNKIFRKAAAHYPLKTSSADWEKISNVLKDERRRNNKLIWLLLLLPFILICTRVVDPIKNNSNLAEETQNKKNFKVNKTAKILSKEATKIIGSAGITNAGNEFAVKDIKHNQGKQSSTLESLNERTESFNTSIIIDKQEFISNEELQKDNKTSFVRDSIVNTSVIADSKRISIDSLENNSILYVKNNVVKPKDEKHRDFSIGIAAGPDFSTVKFQKIRNIGYTFGLITAYRFAKHLSVESGLNFVKKNYYSTGEYFNKAGTGISNDEKIIKLNGACTMLEVPLNIKYDFDQRKKGNFFAVAGLSSYLMKKEKYNYVADHQSNLHSENKAYGNPGNDLFSVLNISGGYELKLNNANHLRIEPYFKVPLGGMGIGSMPIMRTGVTLGVTRTLH
ncbi:PorT family protein [Ilyomonas limi]|uniref:PorT family protein n=1 Tax=Ilyomonas limi TaxID=2575867 RepID=A0A4U3KX84_9BACT|nr:porin family protein [Ilyomonas limi]TKK66284.1 PorT family protein [Ilyomonas limi]